MLRPATPFARYVRHPLEAFGAVILWGIFRILPLDWASGLGGAVAAWIGPKLKISERARTRIKTVFPEKSDFEVEDIIRGTWNNLGRTVSEFPHSSRLSFDPKDGRVEVIGIEHLEQFRDDGEAGIFFSAHIGNWELAPLTAVAYDIDTVFVYREANNRLMERIYLMGRSNLKDILVRKGNEGAKGIMKALREKKHVGMLVDQKMNDGMAVPFFGREAMTAPALAAMALKFKCPIMPARIIRTNGAHFQIELSKPFLAESTGDREADMLQVMIHVNKIIESWIREYPDQWMWLHNRWPKDTADEQS
jgi:KDO2-lipid IV(A) lauroyltransferase